MARLTIGLIPFILLCCVSSCKPSWERFNDLGDGSVLDSGSGLLWQKGPTEQEAYFWQPNDKELSSGQTSAASYCENLTLAGRTDWRLPSPQEARSLIVGCDKGDCADYKGPGPNGCYVAPVFGDCSSAQGKYLRGIWLSGMQLIQFANGKVIQGRPHVAYDVRCVADQPK
jgi:hypothetical protein